MTTPTPPPCDSPHVEMRKSWPNRLDTGVMNQISATDSIVWVRLVADDFLKSHDNTRHSPIRKLFGCIFAGVIVGITKRRGIGDHDCFVTRLPECPMIGPADSRQRVRI